MSCFDCSNLIIPREANSPKSDPQMGVCSRASDDDGGGNDDDGMCLQPLMKGKQEERKTADQNEAAVCDIFA